MSAPRAAGLPFTAIPIFVTRNFHHWAIFYNEKSGIRTPKDLEGRKVGVNRGYTVTTGLWARGNIAERVRGRSQQDHLGPRPMTSTSWISPAPANVDYSQRGKPMKELLLSGVVDAALGEVGIDAPEIKPLIPDARDAAFDYFRRTGVYPINHGVVVKNELLRNEPWIADELLRVFEAAKAEYMKDLDGGDTSWDKAAAVNAKVVGDPFPFGIEKNRKALEAITQFAADQKMVPRRYTVEELFAVPAT